MFVRKKKYECLLTQYELAASRADQAEQQLKELHGMALKNGGLYRCILMCREVAMSMNHGGQETQDLVTARLAFIDKTLSEWLPAVTKQMSDGERLQWNDMLANHSADMADGPNYQPLAEDGR